VVHLQLVLLPEEPHGARDFVCVCVTQTVTLCYHALTWPFGCCTQVHSTYLGDVSPGDNWLGLFNLTAPDTFETVSRNLASGVETKLSCPKQGRNFNWADATLEVYAVKECANMAVGPMTFKNVSLWDENMKPMQPQWLLTGKKPCGGTTTLDKETGSITIEHSP
jgi:hypothetical protein